MEALRARLVESLEAHAKASAQLSDLQTKFAELQELQRTLHSEQRVDLAQTEDPMLREIEGRFKSVMENIPGVAVQGYAADGTVTFWNPASEILYGFSRKEALGGNLLDLIIPAEMRAGVVAAMEHMFTTGEPIPAGELLLKTKSGRAVPVFSSHALIRPIAKPPEMFCLDIDLSERKRIERALHDSELRYRTMVELSVDAIVVHTNELLTYVNPAAVRLFGATSEQELIGKPFASLVHGDDLPVAMERFAALTSGSGTAPAATMRCVRLDGAVVEVEGQATAIPFNGDSAIQVIIRDVTERVRISKALLDSEQRYRTLVEGSPIPAAVHRNRNIVFVNPAAVRMFGASSAAELINTSIVDRVHADSLAGQLDRAALAEQGVPLNVAEAKFLQMDGTPIDVEVQGIGIVYDGEPAINVTWLDVTERNRAMAARIAAMDEAEASQQLRRTFVNFVAHELRSPMQTIENAADIIEMSSQNRLEGREDILEAVNQIRFANDLMRVQIRDLQEYARTTDPQMTLRAVAFPLLELSSQVERAYRPAASAKGLELVVTVQPGTPSTLAGDRLRLLQCVNNLLDNAIKYSSAGTIRVSIWADQSGLSIEVADQGIGIEPPDMAVVLQPFKRGANAPKHIPGTGLGLAVVSNLAKLMGGTLTLKGAAPQGTVALLNLPILSS